MNKWTRQIHRWMSILFTATVILNIVVMSMNPGQQPPPLVVYSKETTTWLLPRAL